MLSINVSVWDLIKCRFAGLNETFRIKSMGVEGNLGRILSKSQNPIDKEEELEVKVVYFFALFLSSKCGPVVCNQLSSCDPAPSVGFSSFFSVHLVCQLLLTSPSSTAVCTLTCSSCFCQ